MQNSFAEEFIYPVSKIDDNNIFVVHQKSVDDVELLLWDVKSKVATKQLSSMFLPSDIKVLPSKQGFSFIDRGRLRIKRFQKRTPRTIDILEPISSILSIFWIDDNHFYFVGKHYRDYKVFLGDISDRSNPEIYQLDDNSSMDYLYPHKVGDTLFSIVKDRLQKYCLIMQEWLPKPYEFKVEMARSGNRTSYQLLFESYEPLCFLHMVNEQQGFFLKCNIMDKAINNEGFLKFSCYICYQQEDSTWQTGHLFSFKLPTQYLIGNSPKRVHDSIHPFLPNYEKRGIIYFINYDETFEKCSLYKYDIANKEITKCLKKCSADYVGCLSPFLLNDQVYHGFILPEHPTKRFFNFDEESGITTLELPTIN